MMTEEVGVQAALEMGYGMDELRSMNWDEFIAVTKLEPRTIKITQKGKSYACLDVAYWDPDKKASTHRRKTIGYYDENDNLVLTGSELDTRPRTKPKPEVYAYTKEIGNTILLQTIAENIGLEHIVNDVFGDDAPAIMTCVYYLVSHSDALCHCEQWSAGSITPIGERLGDQRISELLLKIDENRRELFFQKWLEELGDDDNYALDITSISSYAEGIIQVRAGYNRDKEDLEQINLALLVGSKSRLPGYYTIIPGNINDKTALKRFVRILKAHGFSKFSLVTDKGFYTKENIDELYRMHLRFLIGVENRIIFTSETIDRVRDSIERFDNFYQHGSSSLYCTTETQQWTVNGKNHRCYVHVFFDPQKKHDDEAHFREKLNKVRKGILEGDEAVASSNMAKKYFIVTKGKGSTNVKANQEAIDEHNRNCGFLVLISNHIKDAHDALDIYREKETAESGFDDMKNEMDFKRLRIHTEPSMDGKIFLAFLSLIIRLAMSNVMLANADLCNRSRREVFEEMSLLRKTVIDGKNTLYTERTKLQKQVIKAFGIKTPFRDMIE